MFWQWNKFMQTKICLNEWCIFIGEKQPIENFYFRKSTGKYDTNCKECVKKYKVKYYQKYKNSCDKRTRKWNLENSDRIRSHSKKRYTNQQPWIQEISDFLNQINETRKDPNNSELLQVRCTYCGKWFNPLIKEIQNRAQGIKGTKRGQHNLYCSQECKVSCPTYGVREIPRDHKKISLEDGSEKIVPKDSNERDYKSEVNPAFRKMVFKEDNFTCIYCGESKLDNNELSLHCHHINPRKTHPHLECDLNNGITICKECHKFIHSKIGCRYVDLVHHCNK